eukprot:scaffold865_cov312-Prasinococcus_capsulatus_cf.AAC.3
MGSFVRPPIETILTSGHGGERMHARSGAPPGLPPLGRSGAGALGRRRPVRTRKGPICRRACGWSDAHEDACPLSPRVAPRGQSTLPRRVVVDAARHPPTNARPIRPSVRRAGGRERVRPSAARRCAPCPSPPARSATRAGRGLGLGVGAAPAAGAEVRAGAARDEAVRAGADRQGSWATQASPSPSGARAPDERAFGGDAGAAAESGAGTGGASSRVPRPGGRPGWMHRIARAGDVAAPEAAGRGSCGCHLVGRPTST